MRIKTFLGPIFFIFLSWVVFALPSFLDLTQSLPSNVIIGVVILLNGIALIWALYCLMITPKYLMHIFRNNVLTNKVIAVIMIVAGVILPVYLLYWQVSMILIPSPPTFGGPELTIDLQVLSE